MRYAIFSDIHNKIHALDKVLDHAQSRQVDHYFCLGDIGEYGKDACVTRLRELGITTVFGNWELISWVSFSPENKQWTLELPPIHRETHFWLTHAAPHWPEQIQPFDDFFSKRHTLSLSSLFPKLDNRSVHLQQTITILKQAQVPLLFHGHTHQQIAWRHTESKGIQKITNQSHLKLSEGDIWVIGVGSVGEPEDSAQPSYVIYDDERQVVDMIRV